MHLTRFTDLSLRVLIYLTHNERKGLVTVLKVVQNGHDTQVKMTF